MAAGVTKHFGVERWQTCLLSGAWRTFCARTHRTPCEPERQRVIQAFIHGFIRWQLVMPAFIGGYF